ncbi:MAG: tetratricopeptide repeat protein [Pyrinomonadaceae bacterium]
MSAPDDLTSTIDAAAEPPEVIVRRLVRALDFAEGFWLGFVKSNLHAQRLNAVAACRELLDALNIRLVEIELTAPLNDPLPILRDRLAQERSIVEAPAHALSEQVETSLGKQQKIVFFVYGLEHAIPSSDVYPPALSSFNLNRELYRQDIPCPLVLWLPDYALTALARGAPDFWAWRSGLYEFTPEVDLAERALAPIRYEEDHLASSFSKGAKRERLTLLKGLLADYCELGDGAHEREVQVDILLKIGFMHHELGEWSEAKQALEKALEIAREQADNRRIATASNNLSIQLHKMGDYMGARQLLKESLKINRALENKSGVAASLHQLGTFAGDSGDYSDAKGFYEESLKINREQGNTRDAALTLWGLAIIADQQDKRDEARDLYQQALNTLYEVGDKVSIAGVLHNLGILSVASDDYAEAKRFYRESLGLKRELGYKSGEAISLRQLGLLAFKLGDYTEARDLYRESLSIAHEVGHRGGMGATLHDLGLLEEAEGKYSEGIEHLRQAEKIMLELDIQKTVMLIRTAIKRLEEKAAAQ